MPVITTQNRASISASTEDSWRAPTKTIVANTHAGLIHNPYTSAETPDAGAAEIGQDSIATTTAEPPKSQEAVTLSPQLTALARREQKFRQQEQAFKAKQAAFETSQAEGANLASLKTKLAAKDFSVLEELGVNYDDYTNYLLNKGESAKPEAQALKALQDEVTGLKTQQEENVNKQYEATVNQYRKDIKALVAKDPAYESIKERKAEEHVLQHILDTFNEDGEVLSVEDAAKEIEEAILEEAMAMSQLKKVQAKLAPPKATLPPPQQKTQASIKTLTQQLPSSPARTSAQFQHLSPKERLAQALAKAQRPPQ